MLLQKKEKVPEVKPVPAREQAFAPLPSASFICESLELPKGLRKKDIPLFVSSWADECSPFPHEQTVFGFIGDRAGTKVFCYVALKSKVLSIQKMNTEERFQIPAFAILSLRKNRKPQWVFLREERCLTAIHFAKGSRIPDRVESRYMRKDADESSYWRMRQELQNELLPDGDHVENGLFRVGQIKQGRDGIPSFSVEHIKAPDAKPKVAFAERFASEQSLIDADIRESEILREHFRAKRTGKVVRVLVGANALFALYLGWSQLSLNQQAKETIEMEAMIEQREPIVEAIQNKEQLISLAKNFQGENLRPLDWMMIINAHRPEKVTFERMAIGKDREVLIAGTASTVGEVNVFRDTLVSDTLFKSAELSGVNSGKGGVSFTLKLSLGVDEPDAIVLDGIRNTNTSDSESDATEAEVTQ